jgi:hypothetical protein
MIASHNTDVKSFFYNDKVKEIMDADTMSEPFTYIPITAGHLEVVGGNAIVFGKMIEGYSIIDPDITTEIAYEDVTGLGSRVDLIMSPEQVMVNGQWEVIAYPGIIVYNFGTTYYGGNRVSLGPNFYVCIVASTNSVPSYTNTDWQQLSPNSIPTTRTIYGLLVVHLPMVPKENDWYYITISCASKGIASRTANYEVQAGDTVVELKAGLLTSLSNNGFVVVANAPKSIIWLYPEHDTYSKIPYQTGDINTVYSTFTYNAYILRLGNTLKYPVLKSGASHSFGIVYKDRSGRQCSVMTTDSTTIYIPFYTEPNGIDNLLSSIVILKFKLYHKPPDWAETYEIVYFGNNTMDYFLHIRESDVCKLSYGTYRYSLNVQITFDWTYLQNNRWKMAPYVWEAGDRMRLIGTIDPSSGVVTKYAVLYDYEIESTSTRDGSAVSGDWLIFQAKDHPHDIDLGETAITNLTTDLHGTVVHTTLKGTTTKVKDTITLLGNSGTATICCGTYEAIATWDTSLTKTAQNFAQDAGNIATWAALNITLSWDNGTGIVFEEKTDNVDFPSPTNILIELYRPKKGLGQTIAYGTGMVFDIAIDTYGNKYHKGDVDQIFDVNGICLTQAEVENTANDCWKYVRLNYAYNSGSIEPFWVESIFPSDWWGGQVIDNKLTSCGFPFLYDLSLKQVILDERIRNGGFLLAGTNTNNIAHFVYDGFRDLPEKDGPITGLREIGYTLKVIQEHHETSIYINRVQTFNPDGTSQFTLTDTFLGVMRPMDDNYGCQHPDSIVVNNRSLYYWDNNEGAFIRSDPNGQKVLSGPEYKISRWFKELLTWIRTSGGSSILQVRIGVNNDHEEIWITFRMDTEVRGLIFSEKENRFISEINQITESYVHLGNFFAHLYHQTLWIMNIDEGQDYLSWAGTPTYAEAEVVSNIEPMANKVFNAIALFADHLLQSLDKSIQIPTQASENNELMESNVPIWDKREGVYFGEIMKDGNSLGSFASVYDAKLNGREMRGRYCYVKFYTEEHTEKVRINSVVIISTPSERNV